ncbi:MAG: histidine phosphatase family protein [Pseudomonadota bacterium]
MQRLIVALVRHGEYHQLPDTPSAHQPFPLNANGQAQAVNGGREIAAWLARENLQLSPEIDCSDLLRAWETADLIAGELGEPRLRAFSQLAERCVGSAANLTIAEIEAIVAEDPRCEPLPADWKRNSYFRLPLPGSESLMAAGERVATHIRARMQEVASGNARDVLKIFVGHGAAFRHAAYALGAMEFEDIARRSMYHARPIYFDYDPATGACAQIDGAWKVRDDASID